MKTQVKIIGVMFILSVTACITPPKIMLYKDVSNEEAQRDNFSCQMESQKIQLADWEYRGTFMEGASIKKKQNDIFILCLRSKGYTERQPPH